MSKPLRFRIPCGEEIHTVELIERRVRFVAHPDLFGQVEREEALASLQGLSIEHGGCYRIANGLAAGRLTGGATPEERRLLAHLRGVRIARRVRRKNTTRNT